MGEQSHIDDYIRERLKERVYTASPAYWEQAAALIANDRQQKRRRYLLWWWMLLGSLPIWLLGATTLLMPFDPTGSASDSSQSDRLLPAQSAPAQYSEGTLPYKQADHPEVRANSKQNGDAKKQGLPSSQIGAPTFSQSSIPAKNYGKTASAIPYYVDSSASAAIFASYANDLYPSSSKRKIKQGILAEKLEEIHALLARKAKISAPIKSLLPPTFDSLNIQSYPKHFVGLEAAFLVSKDFNRSELSPSTYNSGLVLGIRYAHAIQPAVRLMTGLRYRNRGGLNSDSTFVSRDFGFGQELTLVTVSPRRLHQIELPLGAELRIKNRHYAYLGGFASLLIDVNGRELTSLQDDLGQQAGLDQGVWGLRRGFRPFQLGGSLGYAYYLGQGTHLGIQANYSWMDATNDGYFRNEVKDRHLDIRLTFSRDIWRR